LHFPCSKFAKIRRRSLLHSEREDVEESGGGSLLFRGADTRGAPYKLFEEDEDDATTTREARALARRRRREDDGASAGDKDGNKNQEAASSRKDAPEIGVAQLSAPSRSSRRRATRPRRRGSRRRAPVTIKSGKSSRCSAPRLTSDEATTRAPAASSAPLATGCHAPVVTRHRCSQNLRARSGGGRRGAARPREPNKRFGVKRRVTYDNHGGRPRQWTRGARVTDRATLASLLVSFGTRPCFLYAFMQQRQKVPHAAHGLPPTAFSPHLGIVQNATQNSPGPD
jgi:hypothetical protein